MSEKGRINDRPHDRDDDRAARRGSVRDVTDPGKLATWQTTTVSVRQETEGPLALGTRLREIHRTPIGKHVESVVEVTAYEPGRTFALCVVEGIPVHAEITFAPSEQGTRLCLRAHGRLSGLMRLIGPLLRIGLERQFTRYCANLKRLIEETPDPTYAAVPAR